MSILTLQLTRSSDLLLRELKLADPCSKGFKHDSKLRHSDANPPMHPPSLDRLQQASLPSPGPVSTQAIKNKMRCKLHRRAKRTSNWLRPPTRSLAYRYAPQKKPFGTSISKTSRIHQPPHSSRGPIVSAVFFQSALEIGYVNVAEPCVCLRRL